MKVDEPKLVMINWLGVTHPEPDWERVEDMEERPLMLHCVTVGWLVWDSEECKGVAPCMAEDELEENKQLKGVMYIPMGAITNFAVLEDEQAFTTLWCDKACV